MQKIEGNFVKGSWNFRFVMLALISSILHLTCWSSEVFSFLQEKTQKTNNQTHEVVTELAAGENFEVCWLKCI